MAAQPTSLKTLSFGFGARMLDITDKSSISIVATRIFKVLHDHHAIGVTTVIAREELQ
jgi:hypothetical protein